MKTPRIITFLLALGFLASTAQANFWYLNRDNDWENKENHKDKDKDKDKNNWKHDRSDHENEKPNRYDRIWSYLNGGEEKKWDFENTESHHEFGDLLEKLREICGSSEEVNKWCEAIKEKQKHNYEYDYERSYDYHPSQPSGSAVPEPSTYGMIGAGALVALIGLRRFKRKATQK
jgi:hypothetical protein